MTAEATSGQETNVWDQMMSLANLRDIPTRQEFVNGLMSVAGVQCLLMLAIGIVYLLYGWQAFKVLVIANAGILGAIAGAYLGGLLKDPNAQADNANIPIFAAIAGALLLAALAWPLMKYAVSVMGALAGSFVGYGIWNYVGGLSGSVTLGNYAWAGALIGLITMGMMAFIVFRETIILFTVIQGAALVVSGLLGLLMKFDAIREPIQRNLINNTHLLPVLILVPALIGLACQQNESAKKKKKKLKPAMA